MQDFIYTAQGIITKSDILEAFVSNSEIIDGKDLYGRGGVIVFDESVPTKCDLSTCGIRKPEQTCSGFKREIVDEKGNKRPQDTDHYDLGMSTCKLSCIATGNNTANAKGCLCSTTKTGAKRCQSRDVEIAFPDNRTPCVKWDPTAVKQKELKVNTSLTGCKPIKEQFVDNVEKEDDDDPMMPFFDQRLFRPSWSLLQ